MPTARQSVTTAQVLLPTAVLLKGSAIGACVMSSTVTNLILPAKVKDIVQILILINYYFTLSIIYI